jgi:hypothetical protein
MVSCPLFVSCVGRVHLFFSIHRSRDDYEELSKLEHELIDITPDPVLTRLEGLDNRVVGRVEMPGGVLILRIVTATDMSTGETETQVYPRIPDSQTILTAIRAGCNVLYLIKMRTSLCHVLFLPDYFPGDAAP